MKINYPYAQTVNVRALSRSLSCSLARSLTKLLSILLCLSSCYGCQLDFLIRKGAVLGGASASVMRRAHVTGLREPENQGVQPPFLFSWASGLLLRPPPATMQFPSAALAGS